MKMPDIIIAIDGYSSTGKSSFAKLVAREFGFIYLDSGAVYRAVTLFAQEEGLISDSGEISPALGDRLGGLDVHFESDGIHIGDRLVEGQIRSLEVSGQVSLISALPFVRNFVDAHLHEWGGRGRIVMDGRDIGTTVFPEAQIKVFMTASEEVRARRRFDELREKGDMTTTLEEVRINLRERDYIDSHRETSPLKQAAGAFVLDNSEMSFVEEIAWIKGLVQGKFTILE